MIRYIEVDDRKYRPRRRRRRRNQADERDARRRRKQSKSLLDKFFDIIRSRGSAKVEAEKPAQSPPESGEWTAEAGEASVPPVPKPKRMWHGLDGLGVTVFGIAMPVVMFGLGAMAIPKRLALMLLNHPVETALELGLIVMVPVANYFVWNAITGNRLKFSRSAAVALGASVATCAIITLICIAAMFTQSEQFAAAVGTDFSTGFAWMAGLAVLAGAASAYVAFRVRNTWDLLSTRRQIAACSGVGVVLALLLFTGAEAKSWVTRTAERMAVSAVPGDAKHGMELLRQLNPERELRMECSDARAAGLAGLFMPIKPSAQHELYFRLTGKPYSFREFANADLASMPDEYLSANVVGEHVKGLSLARSTMIGNIHPNTLTSRFEWTFVFKNDTQSAQEMRAELGLPPGAVVNGFSVWTKGDEKDAAFVPTTADLQNGEGGTYNSSSPGSVADLGHGRVLLSAYPIPQDEEAKVRVSFVIPLNPDATKSASLMLPKFIATNFDLQGEQAIKMHSPLPLSGLNGLTKGITRDGEHTLSGDVKGDELQSSRLVVDCERPAQMKPVYVFDKIATKQARDEQMRKVREAIARREAEMNAELNEDPHQVVFWIDGSKGVKAGQLEEMHRSMAKRGRKYVKPVIKMLENRYVTETTQKLAVSAPSSLQIVIDGSVSVGPHIKELAAALQKLPPKIAAEVVIASREKQPLSERRDLKSALQMLPNAKFIGGQDNLKALVKAAEHAGDTKNGAVLWVHGPQPTLNHEIYIMSPYANAPKFYELPVGAGDTTDTVEYFRNHSEIGPFVQISHVSDNVVDDLQAFFRKWEPNNTAYSAQLALVRVKPADAVAATKEEGEEIMALRAAQATQALLKKRHTAHATVLATKYGFVSSVSQALISDSASAEPMDEQTELVTDSTEKRKPTTEVANALTEESLQSAPQLQGGTNGSIGPQGTDATMISGVNTAGTVRVNNLANLEALLNIIANLSEIGFALAGVVMILHGIARGGDVVVEVMGQEFEFGSGKRITVGAALILIGLCVPGLINFFVASARDANLFS